MNNNKLYRFQYNEMIEESSWATMSIHRTKSGAIKAMRKHKAQERLRWKELFPNHAPHRFGKFQDWHVDEITIQD